MKGANYCQWPDFIEQKALKDGWSGQNDTWPESLSLVSRRVPIWASIIHR